MAEPSPAVPGHDLHRIYDEGYRVIGQVGGYAIDCECGERFFAPSEGAAIDDFAAHREHKAAVVTDDPKGT